METTVIREYRFDAAHNLPWHPGKCRRRHGHSYRFEVRVKGTLDHRGVVMDFGEIDDIVDSAVVAELDHSDLNDILENPTAELIAAWIASRLTDSGLGWGAIRLWETGRGSVEIEYQ